VIAVDIKKLKKAVEVMEEDLGDALIGTDIYSVHDGQGIIGHESRPTANALFNNITTMIIKSLKDAGLPGMGRFYQIDLEGGKLATNMPLGDYVWASLVDIQKVQVGLLNNVILPKLIELFKEAEKG
jgi:hypothetical protein